METGTPIYKLAYRFDITSLLPSEHWAILIDAQTGLLLDKYSLRDHCNNGTVNTLYNGTRTLQTHQDGSSFRLQDYCRPGGLIASKFSGGTSLTTGWGDTNYIYSSNNTWNANFASQATATAQWAIERANDYFWSTFQHKAGRTTDRERRTQVDHPDGGTFYDFVDSKDYYHIGRNPLNSTRSFAELDFVAHEFTHSVVRHSAGLPNNGEGGALNESFADIFGLMTERSINGGTDWVLGTGVQYLRSFANTGRSEQVQAQFFNGPGWVNPASA